MKKGFVLFKDSLEILDKMTNEQAGVFIKKIYEYQKTGELNNIDFAMEMALTPFINQFKRDDDKYKITVERNRINGSSGGRPKKPTKPKKPTGLRKNPVATKKADTDTDKDTKKDKGKTEVGPQNQNFELFWDHFHEYVKQPKSKKDPTLKHWNKLTLDDQRKAYSSVKNYANSKHQDEHEFLSIARTYLSDKLYNDEYGTTERLPDKEKILKRIKELENERS